MFQNRAICSRFFQCRIFFLAANAAFFLAVNFKIRSQILLKVGWTNNWHIQAQLYNRILECSWSLQLRWNILAAFHRCTCSQTNQVLKSRYKKYEFEIYISHVLVISSEQHTRAFILWYYCNIYTVVIIYTCRNLRGKLISWT